MSTWFQLAVAGTGHLVWHWGTGVGLILLCLACAYGTRAITMVPYVGPWLSKQLAPLRHDFIIAAALVALFLAGLYVGQKDERLHCVAQTHVITKVVDRVVKSTKPLPRPDKVPPPDRWDNPEN